jgi:hypothetical protein
MEDELKREFDKRKPWVTRFVINEQAADAGERAADAPVGRLGAGYNLGNYSRDFRREVVQNRLAHEFDQRGEHVATLQLGRINDGG